MCPRINKTSSFDPIAYINEPRWRESRLGLERIHGLLERMGRPQDRLKFVHVAGTNGKGSVCAYLDSILRAAGYHTGLFTSPYIVEFEERIRVDGRNISREDLREVTLFVQEHAEVLAQEMGEHPTEFELMTAVAFEYFARSACDIVVCEVGLGGRLDSTNVIETPQVCVITRIGLDHTSVLGTTVGAIAAEKAGIVKPGAAVVSWPQEPEARTVIQAAAKAVGCQVQEVDFSELAMDNIVDGRREFAYRGVPYTTRLLATYQPGNAAVAIEAARALAGRGWKVSDESVRMGVAEASWPGRFEVLSDSHEAGATLVVDGGHNPQGAHVLAESLRDAFPNERIVFVMSVLADKDYRSMIDAVIPLARAFICAAPPNPRALAANDLARAVEEELVSIRSTCLPQREYSPEASLSRNQEGEADILHPSVKSSGCNVNVVVLVAPNFLWAMEEARRLAGPRGVVCAFGSLYSIADIRKALAR